MMKTISLAAVAVVLTAPAALAGDVSVTLTGVQAGRGVILAALQTQAQFLQPEGAYGERIADAPAGAVRITFRDVAPGDYSLSVLQDSDGDGRMTLSGGMPAEGWAMVNGETLRAAPVFSQVKFTVPASGDVSLDVAMQYPR